MEGSHTVNSGLSTMEALTRLHEGVKIELDECLSIRSFTKGFHTWIRDAYHHNSAHSLFRWTSAAIVGLEILFFSIFYAYGVENFRLKSLEIEMLLLSLFLLFNMCVAGWDSRLRHTEMHIRAEKILHYIEECKDNQPWKIGQYSHLHAPQSPCISLQWTWRDNQLINLPCHLLVEGDIIVLRPGHISPGKCCSVEKNVNTFIELHKGEIFAPADKLAKQSFSSPRLRKPAEAMKFIMMETPYVSSLRLALQDSLKRPVALFNKECHTVISYYLEIIIIPSVIITTVCFGALHAGYLNPANSEWTEHMLLRPILAIMPLVPLTLPVCWIILNVYGMAHLEALVEVSKQSVKSLDPFDEMEDRNLPSFIAPLKWSDIKGNCIALLFGRKGYLWRSANLLQVLGSITALCCVDKKGILSWPNPTAEKVFFLKPSKSKANSEDSTNLLSISAESVQKLDSEDCLKEEEESVLKKVMKLNRRKDLRDHIYHPGSQVEVLDLTHNVNSPYGIQFDDPNWKSYIGNLKPLGLGILLNTCNPSAQQHYSKFCDHIACESLYNDAAVPVVNKRCLCELAKQIGFTYSVVDFYDLQQQISLFRHVVCSVRPEVIQKGRLARSLNFPRLKLPFPNVSYAVVKDLHRGNLQLFSQGTADLILDACNEYWDGEDISVLTESDRKRILDFYHRSSLTAHCMGYAYGPLNMVPDHKFSEMLIELPSDSSHIFPSLKITANSARSWDHQSLNGHNKPLLNRYLSSDSLLLQEQEDSSGNITASINTCLQQLGNGIFIGMVTMQYQACPDFVQLIEQLDKACIRFVHFSKENELRSRVFSEKMGLESGWNCHISLLNEKTWSENCHSKSQQKCEAVSRKSSALHCGINMYDAYQKNSQAPFRCISAPSVINLDMTVVKFEEEISIHSKSTETIVDLCLSKEDDGSHLGVNDELFILQEKEGSSVQDLLIMDDSNLSHSPSHITESTDQSAPVTFDMSNRAKLPKGTENIRPHIENVDNVPLQVSLFTDCTPEATQEMICIMQEYGEVVCCLGSSANSQNMAIFLQADISIAVEPLHPQLCMQQPVFDLPRKKSNTGPFELCGILNSLPCALNFHREDPVSLYHLIMQARHFVINMRNSFQFMLCCCLSITLLQVFAVVFFLPLILPPAHVLWMVCVEIPLLSLSLMGNSMDSNVTTLATGKNTKAFNKQTILLFSMYYCAKFCPSVLASVCCFALIIANYCQQHPGRASDPCWIFLDISENEHGSSREMWAAGLTISQNVTATLIVIYLVFISFGYVHRSTVLCRGKLCPNKYWIISAPVVICMQLIFSVIDIALNIHGTTNPLVFIGKIPFYVWLIGSLWPFILIPLNEIVKKHEIKVNVRQQKRARLEFCTKLGMNSPF